MTTRARHTKARRGMILPLVLIGMLLMLTFSASLQQVAWRAVRGARATWDAQRGFYLVDAGIVQALAEWAPDSVAATPIGTHVDAASLPATGWRVVRSIVRTAPLTAVVHVVAQRSWSTSLTPTDIPQDALGDVTRIRRTATRVVRLEPPTLPVLAAATLLGPAMLDSLFADGRDLPRAYDPLRDDCGPLRDSASVNAVAAERFDLGGTPTLHGAVTTLAPDTLTRARALFDSAFTHLRIRANTITPTALGTVPPVAPWRAAVMQTAGSVTLEGDSHHVGLLAIDGDLTLRGALRIDGALVVRGALDTSQGSLDVHGALVVRDGLATGSTLGPATRVTYAPCLLGRALAAVALPRVSPFEAFNSP